MAVLAAIIVGHQDEAGRQGAAKLIADRGLSVAAVYDNATPAQALRRLLADAHGGGFAVVVLGRIEVLGNELAGALRALSVLAQLGIRVCCADAPWIEALGPLATQLHLWIDSSARQRRGEKLRRALAAARTENRHVGRPVTAVPMEKAIALLATMPLARVARALNVSESTLRRKVREHHAVLRIEAARGAA